MKYQTRERLELVTLFLFSAIFTMFILDMREPAGLTDTCEIQERTQ